MENQLPKTKEECFAILDAIISEENKQIMIRKDYFDYHFTLGLWIRNHWLYPMNEEDYLTLSRVFAVDRKRFKLYIDYNIPISVDELSGEIIRSYIDYLKNK